MCELENGHRFTLSMVNFHGFFYVFVYQRVSPTAPSSPKGPPRPAQRLQVQPRSACWTPQRSDLRDRWPRRAVRPDFQLVDLVDGWKIMRISVCFQNINVKNVYMHISVYIYICVCIYNYYYYIVIIVKLYIHTYSMYCVCV